MAANRRPKMEDVAGEIGEAASLGFTGAIIKGFLRAPQTESP
jgi:hypothetical protein